jgi:MoaA/NifB/PqqE/SkfB family radical SAM enzyme
MHQNLVAAAALFKVHVLRRRMPLLILWNITSRCDARCLYCAAFEINRPELSTSDVKDRLDALWPLGCRWITFGGGEPLLRPDIGEIIRHAKAVGFSVFISTNGWRASERAADLALVDHVNLSLDGPRELHDEIRGQGAFDQAFNALDVCREQRVRVSFQCVLSKFNVEHPEEVLELARLRGIPVMFQPATKWLNSSLKPNPFAPEPEKHARAIEKLIALKKQGALIRNSFTGLQHVAHWPASTPIPCGAGTFTATIESDGSMVACHHQIAEFLSSTPDTDPAGVQFARLALPSGCAQCWCAALVEMNLIFSPSLESIWNAYRMSKYPRY